MTPVRVGLRQRPGRAQPLGGGLAWLVHRKRRAWTLPPFSCTCSPTDPDQGAAACFECPGEFSAVSVWAGCVVTRPGLGGSAQTRTCEHSACRPQCRRGRGALGWTLPHRAFPFVSRSHGAELAPASQGVLRTGSPLQAALTRTAQPALAPLPSPRPHWGSGRRVSVSSGAQEQGLP